MTAMLLSYQSNPSRLPILMEADQGPDEDGSSIDSDESQRDGEELLDNDSQDEDSHR